MASTPGPNPAHRSVASIRAGGAAGVGSRTTTAPDPTSPTGSPHTPLRGISSTFASPSSLRAEEDTIVVELGARRMRVGFAGDALCKGTVEFGPDQMRRVGDFRAWESFYVDDWRKREDPGQQQDWGADRELWRLDLRGLDLGLVADKLERGLRDAFAKYLLIDSRPRKMALVLQTSMPIPLLSTVLDTLFTRFQSPQIFFFSPPVMTTAAAGLRSGLVIDLGWAETVVTSVYQYREVQCTRSVRAGRALVEQTHRLLADEITNPGHGRSRSTDGGSGGGSPPRRLISFSECEDIVSRVIWCRPAGGSARHKPSDSTDGLPTVAEEQEDEPPQNQVDSTPINIRLISTSPPTTVTIPFDRLSEPCEDTFFETQYSRASFDDHEQPIHLLVYKHLLSLPMDVRSICMSRIIFTGGCSAVLGLRGRIFDELTMLVRKRGWDPIWGRGVEQYRTNSRLKRSNGGGGDQSTTVADKPGIGSNGAANAKPAPDPVEAQIKRSSNIDAKKMRDADAASTHGELRAVESLGPWAGASLLAHLKPPVIASVERDQWLAQGVSGAVKAADVDVKATGQQRQSMAAGGLMAMRSASGTGGPAAANWTLGAWGNLSL
ncbi:hypothetical protein PpBr36_01320 [Pyricularia pennisetigena]|uniref:hypothetical protein n=1 Tax=Pyricularia pennisetigena TaxID=1578925 RepID=UPI00114F9FB5|nr:hypothetical protein PpBr36_01320 [Pyricularia pennisetigena]TLS29283.1 hypothetical protein PpBr36_01320 [Pyricularia pennisetigena]